MFIDRFRPEDRPASQALFSRVFGTAQAKTNQARWEWQYALNPNNAGEPPQIWIARDGDQVIGQYASIPVRLSLRDQEIDASWGVDLMVAPERQRQGIGERLFDAWDRHVGASLGMGLSPSAHRLFRKLGWHDVGPVPCLVKPLTSRGICRPNWPSAVNRVVTILAAPVMAAFRLRGAPHPGMRRVEHFDERFTALWERVARKFDLAVRRDAVFLEWKYVAVPHPRSALAALVDSHEVSGYAVYRHADEPRGRTTLLVDLLADPDDDKTLAALLHWVEHEARAAGSDKIRTCVMNTAFRKALRTRGYFPVASTVQLCVKINAVPTGPELYNETSRWHVTLGDCDLDR